MTVFWITAGALSLGALSFVLVPAWQARQRSGQWSMLSTSVAAALVPLSVGVYLAISTWNGERADPAQLPPITELVAGLEVRLRDNPDDVLGWRLLGQSYITLGRYPEARQALREAWARTPMPDNDLRLALGEAEVMADRRALGGAAGQLFEEVLASEPSDPRALWWGGLAALDTARPDLARERWTRLLALGPPDDVAAILREQLSTLGGDVTEPGGAQDRAHVAQADSPAGLELRLRVALAEDLSAEGLGPGAALFIFARSPQGGPPLAVIRRSASAVPGEFALSDADAMLPGTSLADFEALTLVARLSASGQPTASPGDLFGERVYRPSEDGDVIDLVIDQIAE